MSEFFKEKTHLEYFVQRALPELVATHGCGVRRRLTVWSVGCSEGEEPYTLAMVLSEFAARFPGLGFRFLILATDASPEAIQAAKRGIYVESSIASVPVDLRQKYLLRSKDPSRGLVRIAPELRETVKFRKIDFLSEEPRFREPIDAVFCYNVFGRIARRAEERLMRQFYRHVRPGGYVFVEPLDLPGTLTAPLVPVAPAIYRKPAGERTA